ncbi:hypothetical protein Zmor_009743 [Zophobas morio]|uniref:Uncharacterized protein n=1 Tax=Zophobas morio TaxID=2755281 RepID=A0AA38ILV0_9CUCU|nr:hypothetical protein Zmor_009743 [Zophobas morio]
MILLQWILFFILLYTLNATPVSYQYVRYLRNGRVKSETPPRRSRSFGFATKEVLSESHFWNNDDIDPNTNSLTFEEHGGHITPDFSNGLDYPDPLLLTGSAAKRAVAYLYRKPLFFEDIKHLDALLHKQDERRRNGLSGNKLGSLRPHLPFYRFKKSFYSGFF